MESGPSPSAEAQLLLVEDNPGDRRLLKETFREALIQNQLHTVSDGEEAQDFIHRRNQYEDAPRPDMIFLDLFLPKVDGEDLLHEIKHHPELEDVPVIILTGTDEDRIESEDLDHDADEDAVIEKPVDVEDLFDVLRELGTFRVSIVRATAD